MKRRHQERRKIIKKITGVVLQETQKDSGSRFFIDKMYDLGQLNGYECMHLTTWFENT